MKRLRAALVVLLLSLCMRAEAQGGTPLRRFALTVSANNGGLAREPLQYADGDALALSAVLEQLGGIDRADAQRLVQPRASDVIAAFQVLRERVLAVERQGVRTEVVFYYSGHSDDGALLLGPDRLDYGELRRLLEELPTQVRIAILDSCASGAFTREKGGVRRPPFLVDASTEVRGHAFLTSSSADEAAQESDRIGGSFFTHYLVSGLRGAADTSGDRKITLTEAYRFAFEETLARTARTQYGSQHPAYEIRLAGTGDLVMTDLRSTQAELVLDESVAGRLFVWDGQHKLLVEVDKQAGRTVILALPPGTYRVELAQGARFLASEVRAMSGVPSSLGKGAFRDIEREATLARGVVEQFVEAPFAAGVIPPIHTNGSVRKRQPGPLLNHVNVALLYDDPDAVSGLQLGLFGLGARRFVKGLQLGLFFDDTSELLGLQLSGLTNVARTFGSGAQLSLGASYAGLTLHGLQGSGLANYTSALYGVQLALGINIVRERMYGLQLGSLNLAAHADGVQLGWLNLAGELRGIQLGAVNIAAGCVRGVQLGLVNYADEADVSLALLGITQKGGTHLQLAFDELAAPDISLRLDANYNYSFVSVALAPYGARRRGYAIGAGVGAKVPLFIANLWLDLDLGVHMLQSFEHYERGVHNALFRVRAMARYELYRHLSVFAGISFNAAVQGSPERRYVPQVLVKTHVATHDDAHTRVLYWPGFVVGVRL